MFTKIYLVILRLKKKNKLNSLMGNMKIFRQILRLKRMNLSKKC